MDMQKNDCESSGILSKENGGDFFSDKEFCQFSELHGGVYCRIIKAKRYGQWWVLKCLKQEYIGQLFYENLLIKEYDILSRLNHAYIVKSIGIENVHGYGRCIVMEYVEGTTLDAIDVSKSQRRRFAYQLLDAVAYIHSLQIVHRDLKPQNIIVTNNGQNIKIVDFGLADTDNYAVMKQPAGTASYMSPEQKDTPIPDMRNDVYSLGLVLRDLRLGWHYVFAIRRCLGNSQRRYANAGELEKVIKRLSRLPMMLVTLFAILIFAIESIWLAVGGGTKVETHIIRDSVVTDSVIRDSVVLIKQRVDTLIVHDNSLEKAREEMHKKEKEGKEMIDNCMREYKRVMSLPEDIRKREVDNTLEIINECQRRINVFVENSGLDSDQKSGLYYTLLKYISDEYYRGVTNN